MRKLSKRWQLEASDSERHALTKLAAQVIGMKPTGRAQYWLFWMA